MSATKTSTTKTRAAHAKSRVDPGQTVKGGASRRAIFDAALASFRKRGFEQTTMRAIAADAGVALGAAYYYFPSKEAIVHAFYAQTLEQDEAFARTALAKTHDLRARLGAVLHGKLERLRNDRMVLAALFHKAGSLDDEASVFGPKTEGVRRRAIAIFDDVLAHASLEPDVRRMSATALWALHLALLAYFVHDPSPRQARTHALVDGVADLVVDLFETAPAMLGLLVTRVRPLLVAARLST